MYENYKGTLLVAIAQNGRNNILPISFDVFEGEIVRAYFFFL